MAVTEMFKKSPPFMYSEDSLPFSQNSTTGIYREPEESKPHPHTLYH